MKKPDIHANEKERLEALYSYQLLVKVEQKEFNDIVNLAAQICETPISLITLLDVSNQWHKADFGLGVKKIKREHSFCGHAINQPAEILIVEDATKDERFFDNPLVTGELNIVFYAGIPLVTDDGFALGALCVMDRNPRQLNANQLTALQVLARQVMRLFELQKTVKDSGDREDFWKLSLKNRDELTGVIAQDLKTPLREIELVLEVLKKKHLSDLDEESVSFLNAVHQESTESLVFVQQIQQYSKLVNSYSMDHSLIDMNELIAALLEKIDRPKSLTIKIAKKLPSIYHSLFAIGFIFKILIQKTIYHQDGDSPLIKVDYQNLTTTHQFTFSANESGINRQDNPHIFRLFENSEDYITQQIQKVGPELAAVKSLINLIGGHISIDSGEGLPAIIQLQIPRRIK